MAQPNKFRARLWPLDFVQFFFSCLLATKARKPSRRRIPRTVFWRLRWGFPNRYHRFQMQLPFPGWNVTIPELLECYNSWHPKIQESLECCNSWTFFKFCWTSANSFRTSGKKNFLKFWKKISNTWEYWWASQHFWKVYCIVEKLQTFRNVPKSRQTLYLGS